MGPFLMSDRARKRRIARLIDRIEGLEAAMRNDLAALIELTEPGDDLHVEACQVLERLEG
jgi:hypothetical protein